MKKRTIAVVAVLAAGGATAAYLGTRPRPVEVTLTAVELGDVRASASNTRAGTVDACNRARMAPVMGGQIARLPVQEGDSVEAGQILMELWNADLRAQVSLAERDRAAAVSRAEEACASAEVARREAARMSRLRERGLASEEDADVANGEATARSASCRAARGMIAVADAQVAVHQATLERTILRAPFAGTIAEINGEVGEVVTPSPVGIPTPPAVDLIDNSCIYVTAPIDEVDAPGIRAGMSATITLDAFPGEAFPATVRRVAPYVLDREKQARTVDIEAEFDTPTERLLPGYSADVEVVLDVHEAVLRIPTQAVIGGDSVLLLGADGVLREQAIRTGLSNWQVTEVVDGLSEGQRIVLSVDRAGVVPGALAVAEDAAADTAQ